MIQKTQTTSAKKKWQTAINRSIDDSRPEAVILWRRKKANKESQKNISHWTPYWRKFMFVNKESFYSFVCIFHGVSLPVLNETMMMMMTTTLTMTGHRTKSSCVVKEVASSKKKSILHGSAFCLFIFHCEKVIKNVTRDLKSFETKKKSRLNLLQLFHLNLII